MYFGWLAHVEGSLGTMCTNHVLHVESRKSAMAMDERKHNAQLALPMGDAYCTKVETHCSIPELAIYSLKPVADNSACPQPPGEYLHKYEPGV